MIVIASDGGTAQYGDLGKRPELSFNLTSPVQASLTTDDCGRREQTATELGLFIHHHDARARPRGPQRCDQSCRTGTDDQNVTVGVALVILIWVRQ